MRRLARHDDLAAVHAIYMHETVIPYLSHEPAALADFAAAFDEILAPGNFYVWEASGAVAGFYKVERASGRASHVALLGLLAVEPEFQGRGVAKAMMADCLQRLEADGVTRATLLVEADNARAIAFYTRLGFAREGVQRFGFRRLGGGYIDDIMMVRFLGDLQRADS